MINLNAADVHRYLPMADAIDCVEGVMRRVAKGEANMPLRTVMDIDGTNMLGVMPGALRNPTVYGIKVLSLFPGNPARGLSSHIGLVVLFDSDTGAPLVTMNADAVTAIRTAAASAAATRVLARADSRVLAMIGTGEQAESHIEALRLVREIAEVRIAGRTPERAAQFVQKVAKHHPGIEILAAGSAQAAVQGADIICTVTSSREVVLESAAVGPGTHVNAVGASVPSMQEIDENLILKSEVFVDYMPSALAEAREIMSALETGSMDSSHIRGEIGAVYDGSVPGRSGAGAITLYRSLGIAAQDLACADLIWSRHLENG